MWGLKDTTKNKLMEDGNFTFLGKGVDFRGVVHFEGTVRIDGRLDGEIHTTGTLIVGEHAVIKGIISAGTLVTSGKIKGTVTATSKVQLLKPGILIGDVRTPCISVEEGAHYHGLCDMGAEKWGTDDPALDKVHDLAAHRGKVRGQDFQSS